MSSYHVLVLGGYGNFGNRICLALAEDERIHLTVAGRNADAAYRVACSLPGGPDRHRAQALDVLDPGLSADLREAQPDLVIHTCGPFQNQPYHVANACLEAGCDYIDLADGREFVSNFHQLDEAARRAGRLLVTGASTLPGISSAVIRAHENKFSRLEAVRIGITPGQRTPRGTATVAAVLSYCGCSFPQLEGGVWVNRYGWQNLQRKSHPELGPRLWGACDVPDLELLPRRWPTLGTVSFHAGLELRSLQLGLWLASWSCRLRVARDWSRHASWLKRIVDRFDVFGSDDGGMFLQMEGAGLRGEPRQLHWWLTARDGCGPFIPCVPAVILARQLAAGHIVRKGAVACLDLFSLQEVLEAVRDLPIEGWTVEG